MSLQFLEPQLILRRSYRTPENEHTFGNLLVPERPLCVTLENGWKNNERYISCIPAGDYILDLSHQSPKYGNVPLIEDVPNRDNCLLHWGNRVRDTQGCILLAASFGVLESEPAILNSRKTFDYVFGLLISIYGDKVRFRIEEPNYE